MHSKIIQDARKFFAAYKLKFTYRYTDRTIYNGEKESVAAHTWGMMIIADYLLEVLEKLAPRKYTLSREKIYSLITYHDLIEAETGDIDLDPKLSEAHANKHANETLAMQTFPAKLPLELQKRFREMYEEYEKRESLESQFVKIVDILDAEFICIDRKDFFVNYSKDFYEEKRRKHFEKIPELLPLHEEILSFFLENKYFE